MANAAADTTTRPAAIAGNTDDWYRIQAHGYTSGQTTYDFIAWSDIPRNHISQSFVFLCVGVYGNGNKYKVGDTIATALTWNATGHWYAVLIDSSGYVTGISQILNNNSGGPVGQSCWVSAI